MSEQEIDALKKRISELEKLDAKRKKTEEELRHTKDYLENLLNYANAPIIVWDDKFHITIFNHAFEQLTGRKEKEVIGQELEILFPEDTKEKSMQLIRQALSGERWEIVEIPIRHIDGSVRTVLWNSATIYSPDDKRPIATIAQGQDITERKKAQDKIRETAEEWQRTFDTISDMIFIQNNDHTILRVNKSFAAALKMSPGDIIGKKCYELLHKMNSPWPDCPFERTKKDKAVHIQEVDDVNTGIPLLITTSPIFNDNGELAGSVHIAKDITFIKNEEKELNKKIHDLEIFNKVAVGRELKMAELKKRIEELEGKKNA